MNYRVKFKMLDVNRSSSDAIVYAPVVADFSDLPTALQFVEITLYSMNDVRKISIKKVNI